MLLLSLNAVIDFLLWLEYLKQPNDTKWPETNFL